MKKAVRLYISGNFQPLFFKGYIKEKAEKLGVKGFVRSLEDGRIEVFLEGNPDEVKKAVDICKKGQRHSQIKDVVEKPEKFQDLRNFKVLHI